MQQAQPATQRAFQQYETAVKNQNPIEILTTMQVYHQALKREITLKQQTKLARIKLERLSGQPAVAQLVLVPQPKLALQKATEPAQATALAFPALQLVVPEGIEKVVTPPVKPTVKESVNAVVKQVKQLKLPFKEDTLF